MSSRAKHRSPSGRHDARRDHAVHLFFEIGVIFKGIDGALEVIGAIVLGLVPKWRLVGWARFLTRGELSEDPHDFVASRLLSVARHLSLGQKEFATVYLLSHGAVKVLLVWALLARKLWAYPLAIAVFLGFAAYQIYEFALGHSFSMIVLTVLDFFVIGLTWAEYRRLKTPGR